VSAIDESHLHADPGIDGHHPHHGLSAPPTHGSAASPLQRERARTIFQKGARGRRAFVCPERDVPPVDADELLPARLRRAAPARLPEVSEPEIVRHYVGISKRNFDLDSGFYPLGSCTMKHNPRLHERVAALPGHARLHPLQDDERAQGALEAADMFSEILRRFPEDGPSRFYLQRCQACLLSSPDKSWDPIVKLDRK